MPSKADELGNRVKGFAVRVLKFVKTLPREPAVDGIARQLARAGPSVSANYHSARRARSRAEFISRLAIVVDEADEAAGWCEALQKANLASGPELDWLLGEAGELRAIFSHSVMTARANNKHHP